MALWILLILMMIVMMLNNDKVEGFTYSSVKVVDNDGDVNRFNKAEFGREELIKKGVARRLVKIYSNRPYIYYEKNGDKIKLKEMRDLGLPAIITYGLLLDEAAMRKYNRVDNAAAPSFSDGKIDSTIGQNIFKLEGSKVVGRGMRDDVIEETIYYYADYDNMENNIDDNEKSLFCDDKNNITYDYVGKQKIGKVKKLEPFDKIEMNGITHNMYDAFELIETKYYIKLEYFGNSSNIEQIIDKYHKMHYTNENNKIKIRVNALKWNEVYRLILVLSSLANVSAVELKN